MYLLDTNICIYALNNKYPALTSKLFSIHPDQIVISAVTVHELEYGAAKSRWSERNRQKMNGFLANFEILPFTDQDALVSGRLRALLEKTGTPIGGYDLMIASQGISRGLTVVTHNIKEFIRIPGILLEDWAEEFN